LGLGYVADKYSAKCTRLAELSDIVKIIEAVIRHPKLILKIKKTKNACGIPSNSKSVGKCKQITSGHILDIIFANGFKVI